MPGKGPGDDLIYEMQSSLSVCGTTLSGHNGPPAFYTPKQTLGAKQDIQTMI